MPTPRRSYRDRFHSSAEASSYDRNEYSPEGYPSLLWQLEQDVLRGVVEDLRRAKGEIDYLDFACGTGRVLAFMEPLVDRSTGVEVSEAMLEVAGQKVRHAQLVRADITVDPNAVPGPFDLITAFRFVLNAEPELRRLAFHRLGGLLRDERSMLVFNNHINLWSYKLGTWPKQRLSPSARRGPYRPNFLTDSAIRRLGSELGLAVQRVAGFGFLSRRALSLVPFDRLLAAERGLARVHPLKRFGVDQIYIARRA